ncbi:DNA/RNA nuclease SfsA [Leptolyngbya sp. FACHB-261]|uniref:DNA/RNA nuclease SfsA n=1 Tax=Leptolyngbya sp. FACHB-261 TaxID=2692806 RepID=UPI0016852425|nr:DNA/RNA nuclease SfsA [Leptolyngbya sp. FACHB-261]MBD2103284.1 DNA/RNA nuclease SfsA [Leptolyngbya sp. FACHB-261]
MPEPISIYQYPPLSEGILLRRYKRFFAEIQLTTGQVITAHCPNTGPMTGISTPGSAVQVSHSDSPTRKLKYTWEMIQVQDNKTPAWVGVNTGLPNRLVLRTLEAGLLPELGSYRVIRKEIPYGLENSRIDFLLEGDELPIYLEVKSTTWAKGALALFPDTVTIRGQKHLRELTALAVPDQSRSVILYFINRGDCNCFAPGDSADPAYGKYLRAAVAAGVEVLPCRFEITPQGVTFLGLAETLLQEP